MHNIFILFSFLFWVMIFMTKPQLFADYACLCSLACPWKNDGCEQGCLERDFNVCGPNINLEMKQSFCRYLWNFSFFFFLSLVLLFKNRTQFHSLSWLTHLSQIICKGPKTFSVLSKNLYCMVTSLMPTFYSLTEVKWITH